MSRVSVVLIMVFGLYVGAKASDTDFCKLKDGTVIPIRNAIETSTEITLMLTNGDVKTLSRSEVETIDRSGSKERESEKAKAQARALDDKIPWNDLNAEEQRMRQERDRQREVSKVEMRQVAAANASRHKQAIDKQQRLKARARAADTKIPWNELTEEEQKIRTAIMQDHAEAAAANWRASQRPRGQPRTGD